MYGLRILCGWLSVLLVAAGFAVGLHEAFDIYRNPGDQLEYTLGSMIGMLAYVAIVWAFYGLVAVLKKLIERKRF